MIYILTVVALCILIYIFDLGERNTKFARVCFDLMTIWFILVSGFAYNVGSDIPGYMYEYDSFSYKTVTRISDLFRFQDNRSFFWILLEYICHSLSSNFVLFKLVIAIICNLAFSRFIIGHSRYPFTSLLFYGLILYLNLNFNALRQSLAISFFLMGYDDMVEKKWIKYYAFVTCAYLFHSSAIICFFLPLFHLLHINKTNLIIIATILVASIFIILKMDMIDIVYQFVLDNAELVPEDYLELSDAYLGGDTDSNEANLNGMIMIAIQIILLFYIIFVNMIYSKKDNQSFAISLLVFYAVLVIMNRAIPVVFTRFMQYFDIFYCCLLPGAIIPVFKRITRLRIVSFIIITMFAILPITTLLSINKQTDVPLMVQYSPYYSVFNPKIDPKRSILFGSHK